MWQRIIFFVKTILRNQNFQISRTLFCELCQKPVACWVAVPFEVTGVWCRVTADVTLILFSVYKQPHVRSCHYHRFLFNLLQRVIIAAFDRGILPSGKPAFFNNAVFLSLICFRNCATDQSAYLPFVGFTYGFFGFFCLAFARRFKIVFLVLWIWTRHVWN